MEREQGAFVAGSSHAFSEFISASSNQSTARQPILAATAGDVSRADSIDSDLLLDSQDIENEHNFTPKRDLYNRHQLSLFLFKAKKQIGHLATYIMNIPFAYRMAFLAFLFIVFLVALIHGTTTSEAKSTATFDINNVPGSSDGGEFGLRGYDYCQADYPNSTQYKPLSTTAKLVHLQMVIRHGDRVPKSPVLPNELVDWRCDDMIEIAHTNDNKAGSDQFNGPDVADYSTHIVIPSKKVFNDTVWSKGSCVLGQLTSKGARQHMDLGKQFRSIYVDQLKYLPATIAKKDLTSNGEHGGNVYFRSTDMWRTKQSAASFLTGVWPKKNARAADAQILPIIVYPYEVETMRSRKDNTCPRFDEIKDNMRKSDQYHAVFARHNSLRDRLEKILGTGGIEKYKKSWTKYMDPLRARVCHNMTLPCLNNECLTVRDVDELNQGVNEEVAMMYGALPEAKEHNLLSLGYFMGELRDRLMNAVNGASTVSSDDNGHAAILTPKFELFSGHDTTVYGLIGLLLAKDLRWPPYASNLIFELWQDPKPDMKHNDPNNYVIRIIYNGRSLAADWCDFKACPLPKYLEHIEEYIERDLSNACKTH